MNDEPQPMRITREALRDGSLIAAARKRMAPGMRVRSDADLARRLEDRESFYLDVAERGA